MCQLALPHWGKFFRRFRLILFVLTEAAVHNMGKPLATFCQLLQTQHKDTGGPADLLISSGYEKYKA